MILNKMFGSSAMDYTKRCKLRIVAGAGLIILGVIALVTASMYGTMLSAYISENPDGSDFVQGFYTGIGGGLIVAAAITIIRNYQYLKNPEKRKVRELYENDERNRLIGTKCWAYAGYALFLALYVGILVAGFINVLILKVLLGVLAVYGIFLLLFRILLQKAM